jgi:DNA repair protein RadC
VRLLGTFADLPIPSWSVHERPRERLFTGGTGQLADAELLALLLGSGVKTSRGTMSALSIGRMLMAEFVTLRRLSRRDVQEWMQVAGVGRAGAARLASAFEIGRRVASEPIGDRPSIRCPADVAALLGPRLRDLDREEFWVLHLSTAGEVTYRERASQGGLSASIVEPRLVYRSALLQGAAAVICAHNHPSGNPEPSADDLAVTRQLVEAGRVVGIPMRDHVIIAGDGFTSLAERGAL